MNAHDTPVIGSIEIPIEPAHTSADIAAEQSIMPVRSLKILTLNLHKGFTSFNRRFVLHELREAIRSVAADIVFLQEVLGDDAAARPKGVNWPGLPQYEFLADSLWPHFSYGRNAIYPHGHHGNAVLSKFPIVSYRNVDISIAGPERRGMLHCVLRVPGWTRDVHAICVHLGLLAKHRLQQMSLMCDLSNTLPTNAPLIVAGDFNDWTQRANGVLRRCAAMDELFTVARGQPARTFPAFAPFLRLDRIYQRNLVGIEQRVLSSLPWSRLSDHAALFAEVRR